MKLSSGCASAVLVFVSSIIVLCTCAAVISKVNTTALDRDALCPSQLCSFSLKTELTTSRWCSCDPDCDKFQDCCYDYSIKRNGNQNNLFLKPHPKAVITCTFVPSLGWSMLVSSCALGVTRNPNVTSASRRLCSGKSEVQPHMLDIPVTSASSGLTYKNVHCAVCNDDAQDLLPRKATLKSSVLVKGSGVPLEGALYEDGALSWVQILDYGPRDLSQEEGSGGREDFAKVVDRDRVAAGLREFLSSSNVNVSNEGNLAENRGKVQQDTEVLHDYEEVIGNNGDDGNYNEASPAEQTLGFKGKSSSRGGLKTLKDLLNKEVWTSQGRLSSSTEGYMDYDGDLIMQRKNNQESRSVSPGTMAKIKLLLDSDLVRPCGRFLDSCDPNWEREKDDASQLCPTYSMPVYSFGKETGRRTFKNPHCALCNYVASSELDCLDPGNVISINRIWGKIMLSQIDFTFGNVIEGHINCGKRSVWDPLFNRCYYLDVVKGIDESIMTPDPLSIAMTEVSTKLKQTVPLHEDYFRGEEDYCRDITLLKMSQVQWYLAFAFFGVSIVCLGLHVVAYAYPRKLVESSQREAGNTHIRNVSRSSPESEQITGQSFIILSWLLLIGQLLFVVGVRRSEIRTVCLSIAILHNFLSLAAISWLSVFCLQVFKSHFSMPSFKSTVSLDSGSEAPPLKLSLIAWIIPTVFSSLCLTLELVPGDLRPCLARGNACWYGETVSFRIFFVLPALLMLAGDGCIFTAIIFGIREKKDQNVSTSSRGKSNSHIRKRSNSLTNYDHRCFRLGARLGIIMTISWSCAVAASLGNLPSLWYGFVIFSGIQGIYIFVASGTKSRLSDLIWAKATGQSGQVRRERCRSG